MDLSNGITVPTERILSRTISDTIYFEFKATSILSKSVISRKREHHLAPPSEVQRALLFLVCQISTLTSAERVSHPWPARRRGRSRRRAVRGATNTGRHHNADYHTSTAALLAISVATLPSVPW